MEFHVFDYLKEPVLVTEDLTERIVYANYQFLAQVGDASSDDVLGKKKSDTYNELKNKGCVFRDIIMTIDEVKYRIEVAESLKDPYEEKSKRYEMHEKLINEALGIASKERDMEKVINKFLELIGEKMMADRVYIFEFEEDCARNTYEWCGEGITAQIENLQNISMEDICVWIDLFKQSGKVYIRHLEDIREKHPEVYKVLEPQAIDSLLAKPLYLNDQMIGFYGVDNVAQNYLEDIETMMNICSTMFSMLLDKRDCFRRMEILGTRDSMTGLYNRASAENMIEEVLEEKRGAFLILDLDNFKQVNDMFGHHRGDLLLQEVAEKLHCICRGTDIVFRIGGDEFGIYFPTLTDHSIINQKCQNLSNELCIEVKEGEVCVQVSASIGVSCADEQHCNFLKLYQKADQALYTSKENGKNKFTIA